MRLAAAAAISFFVSSITSAQGINAGEDKVAELWGFLSTREANLMLCMKRHPEDAIRRVHEEVIIQNVRMRHRIAAFLKAQGRSDAWIEENLKGGKDIAKRSVAKTADERRNDFAKLCGAVPLTSAQHSYMFIPLERAFPDALRYLADF